MGDELLFLYTCIFGFISLYFLYCDIFTNNHSKSCASTPVDWHSQVKKWMLKIINRTINNGKCKLTVSSGCLNGTRGFGGHVHNLFQLWSETQSRLNHNVIHRKNEWAEFFCDVLVHITNSFRHIFRTTSISFITFYDVTSLALTSTLHRYNIEQHSACAFVLVLTQL